MEDKTTLPPMELPIETEVKPSGSLPPMEFPSNDPISTPEELRASIDIGRTVGEYSPLNEGFAKESWDAIRRASLGIATSFANTANFFNDEENQYTKGIRYMMSKNQDVYGRPEDIGFIPRAVEGIVSSIPAIAAAAATSGLGEIVAGGSAALRALPAVQRAAKLTEIMRAANIASGATFFAQTLGDSKEEIDAIAGGRLTETQKRGLAAAEALNWATVMSLYGLDAKLGLGINRLGESLFKKASKDVIGEIASKEAGKVTLEQLGKYSIGKPWAGGIKNTIKGIGKIEMAQMVGASGNMFLNEAASGKDLDVVGAGLAQGWEALPATTLLVGLGAFVKAENDYAFKKALTDNIDNKDAKKSTEQIQRLYGETDPELLRQKMQPDLDLIAAVKGNLTRNGVSENDANVTSQFIWGVSRNLADIERASEIDPGSTPGKFLSSFQLAFSSMSKEDIAKLGEMSKAGKSDSDLFDFLVSKSKGFADAFDNVQKTALAMELERQNKALSGDLERVSGGKRSEESSKGLRDLLSANLTGLVTKYKITDKFIPLAVVKEAMPQHAYVSLMAAPLTDVEVGSGAKYTAVAKNGGIELVPQAVEAGKPIKPKIVKKNAAAIQANIEADQQRIAQGLAEITGASTPADAAEQSAMQLVSEKEKVEQIQSYSHDRYLSALSENIRLKNGIGGLESLSRAWDAEPPYNAEAPKKTPLMLGGDVGNPDISLEAEMKQRNIKDWEEHNRKLVEELRLAIFEHHEGIKDQQALDARNMVEEFWKRYPDVSNDRIERATVDALNAMPEDVPEEYRRILMERIPGVDLTKKSESPKQRGAQPKAVKEFKDLWAAMVEKDPRLVEFRQKVREIEAMKNAPKGPAMTSDRTQNKSPRAIYFPSHMLAVYFRDASPINLIEEWMHHVTTQGLMPERYIKALENVYGPQRDEKGRSNPAFHENVVTAFYKYIVNNDIPSNADMNIMGAFNWMKGALSASGEKFLEYGKQEGVPMSPETDAIFKKLISEVKDPELYGDVGDAVSESMQNNPPSNESIDTETDNLRGDPEASAAGVYAQLTDELKAKYTGLQKPPANFDDLPDEVKQGIVELLSDQPMSSYRGLGNEGTTIVQAIKRKMGRYLSDNEFEDIRTRVTGALNGDQTQMAWVKRNVKPEDYQKLFAGDRPLLSNRETDPEVEKARIIEPADVHRIGTGVLGIVRDGTAEIKKGPENDRWATHGGLFGEDQYSIRAHRFYIEKSGDKFIVSTWTTPSLETWHKIQDAAEKFGMPVDSFYVVGDRYLMSERDQEDTAKFTAHEKLRIGMTQASAEDILARRQPGVVSNPTTGELHPIDDPLAHALMEERHHISDMMTDVNSHDGLDVDGKWTKDNWPYSDIPYDKWAKARIVTPSGAPSRLLPHDVITTLTENFKNWFGDWTKISDQWPMVTDWSEDTSKVLDQHTGEPAYVYHYTRKMMSAEHHDMIRQVLGSEPMQNKETDLVYLRPSISDMGIHLAESPEQAFGAWMGNFSNESRKRMKPDQIPEHARIFRGWANIRKPLRLTDLGNFDPLYVLPQLVDKGVITPAEYDSAIGVLTKAQNEYTGQEVGQIWHDMARKMLSAKGHDGVVYLNRREGLRDSPWNLGHRVEDIDKMDDAEFKYEFPEAKDSWIIMDAPQFKSVHNQGTFDPNNSLMLWSSRAEEINKEFRQQERNYQNRISNILFPELGGIKSLKELGLVPDESKPKEDWRYDPVLHAARVARLKAALQPRGRAPAKKILWKNSALKASAENMIGDLGEQMKNVADDPDVVGYQSSGGPAMWQNLKKAINWGAQAVARWFDFIDTGFAHFGLNGRIKVMEDIRAELQNADRNAAQMSQMYAKDALKTYGQINRYRAVTLDGREYTLQQAIGLYVNANGEKIPFNSDAEAISHYTEKVKAGTISQAEFNVLALLTSNSQPTRQTPKVTAKSINEAIDHIKGLPELSPVIQFTQDEMVKRHSEVKQLVDGLTGRSDFIGKLEGLYMSWQREDGSFLGDHILEAISSEGKLPIIQSGVGLPAPLKSRVRYNGAPINLDYFDSVENYVGRLDNFMAKAPVAKKTLLFMDNPETQRTIRQKFGNDGIKHWQMLKNQINGIVYPSGRSRGYGPGEFQLAKLRTNTSIAGIGFKPWIEGLNYISMITAMGDLEVKSAISNFSKAWAHAMARRFSFSQKFGAKVSANPLEGYAPYEQAAKESPLISAMSIDIEQYEAFKQKNSAFDKLLQKMGIADSAASFAFYGIRTVDSVVRLATYISARDVKYRELVTANAGASPEVLKNLYRKSINYGEKMAMEHVPVNWSSRRAHFQTEHEGLRLLWPFSTQLITYFNKYTKEFTIPFMSAYKMAKGGEGDRLMAGGKALWDNGAARKAFWYMAVPSMVMGIISRRRLPSEDEWWKDMLTYPLASFIPFGVGASIQNWVTYGELRLTPVIMMNDIQRGLGGVGKLIDAVHQTQGADQYLKAISDVNAPLSDLLGIPKYFTTNIPQGMRDARHAASFADAAKISLEYSLFGGPPVK